MLKKNDIITVKVTDINNLGNGIARNEGQVVFVQGGVTGDEVEIKIIKTAKDYSVARIERIITPSPFRRESDCEYSNRCGGCVYRNITREYELEIKRKYVESALKKNGVEAVVEKTVTNGIVDGCRNKAQYPVNSEGDAGFYARHSHDVVKCDHCRLVPEEFSVILKAVTDSIKNYRIKNIRHICLRKATVTEEIMLTLVCGEKDPDFPIGFIESITEASDKIKSVILNINTDDTNVILGKECKVLFGKETIGDTLLGLSFEISARAFYQVNHGMTEKLYEEAISRAEKGSPEKVCDLFCGTGTIGLILASRLEKVKLTGVEIVPEAVENARINAERNGVSNAKFICADAMTTDVSGFDCIMIDPPRKGMAKELCDKLVSEKPKSIVYISCNPDTLARDARILIDGGYKISSVKPFDMFPRTGAIECVTDFVFGGEKDEK